MNYNIISLVKSHLLKYPCPININFLWNYGFLLALIMVIQIISGVLIATQYAPVTTHAFYSIQQILREIWSGWCIRYVHSTGASAVFLLIYIHILKGLNYSFSYLPQSWCSGMTMFILCVIIAFMGYVLPWGQMSFWGATVITNLLYFIPGLINWVCGGFIISDPTIKRFFVLHYMFPFIVIIIVFIHMYFLHISGSSNPLGYDTPLKIPFYPSLLILDIKAFHIILFLFFFQTIFGVIPASHPDNAIQVNRYQTPSHIVPEWYFLSFYAIIKTIPNKTSGLLIMLSLLQFMYLISEQRNLNSVILFKFKIGPRDYTLSTIWFMCVYYALACIGYQVPQDVYISYGRIFIAILFICCTFIVVKFRRILYDYSSQAHI